MLHGWGMQSAVWKACQQAIAPGWTQHPVDLPGHGSGHFSAATRDLWSWTDACLERAPERALWLGWSLGGLIALAAALRAPARVAGLVLLTATPRFVQATDWTPAMPESTLDQFRAGLADDPKGTLSRFLALQVRGSETARETLRALRHELSERPDPDPQALSVGLDILADGDLRGRLPDIKCPALWIFGERDTLTPPGVAERVEMLMPGAQTRVIRGAAHAPQLSHPQETAAEIAGFLADLESAPTSAEAPGDV